MRVALVHEWLAAHTGSERTLEAIAALFPDAPIHALVWDESALAHTALAGRKVIPSFIQRLPGARRKYQRYLPLMPMAVEQFDLRDYDVIISSSHAVAKGVLIGAEQLHISYVHTPMRYAWDLYQDYLDGAYLRRGLRGAMARMVLHYLRQWDVAAANRVDHYIANSHYVARRIAKTYRREAAVIHPPVDVDRFRADQSRDGFYLAVGRLVPYKRTELIIEAFNELGRELDRELIVIGDGPERRRLAKLAGPRVKLLSEQPDAVIADYMARCRALVFAAEEDFGIVPVEAQAAGAPVIAGRWGGVRETVVDGETGVLYDALGSGDDQAGETASGSRSGVRSGAEGKWRGVVESLIVAVRRFEEKQDAGEGFDAAAIRTHAEAFSRPRFEREFRDFVTQAWAAWR